MKKIVIEDPRDIPAIVDEQKKQVNQIFNLQFGEILVREEALTQEQLDTGLAQQKKEHNKHLGRILVDLNIITTEEVNAAVAKKFGIPYVAIEECVINPNVLSMIPADVATEHGVLPLHKAKGRLYVAMENPLDRAALEVLDFNTSLKIEPLMASGRDILLALNKYYSIFDEIDGLEDNELDTIINDKKSPKTEQDLTYQANKKPIVRLLNAIVKQGVIQNASDIHIQPAQDHFDIYYRIDGQPQLSRSLQLPLLSPLVSRIKIIGDMDIADRRLPQEGRARIKHDDNEIDMRLSIIPTIHGESVVIRLLNKQTGLKRLDLIGLSKEDLARTKAALTIPHGLFLVTGPTGSGKSTTLYALLNEIKKTHKHILSVEDPVEYNIDGVEQVQISEVKELTFADTLRHFLRHDPDVIMVGEIRDRETADLSNKAALTGHLVLSSLHTNDATSTINRLVNMGIESYLLGNTLLGIISQRLIRVNCKYCAVKDDINPVVRSSLGIPADTVLYRGEGCHECNSTGYHSRTLVAEVLIIDPSLRELITSGASQSEITRVALSHGMTPLVNNAVELAIHGKTSIEEVLALRA